MRNSTNLQQWRISDFKAEKKDSDAFIFHELLIPGNVSLPHVPEITTRFPNRITNSFTNRIQNANEGMAGVLVCRVCLAQDGKPTPASSACRSLGRGPKHQPGSCELLVDDQSRQAKLGELGLHLALPAQPLAFKLLAAFAPAFGSPRLLRSFKKAPLHPVCRPLVGALVHNRLLASGNGVITHCRPELRVGRRPMAWQAISQLKRALCTQPSPLRTQQHCNVEVGLPSLMLFPKHCQLLHNVRVVSGPTCFAWVRKNAASTQFPISSLLISLMSLKSETS